MLLRKTHLAPFERYRPLINDWAAFEAALQRPLPTCLWTNTLRIRPEALAPLLAADVPIEPLAWHPGGFKLPAEAKPGRQWPFLAGLCHVQEEVSMLPLRFLDVYPGQRILDLCAAPGNKTAQIAVQMQNRGTVVANDISAGRMRALRQVQERLGLLNITTTVYDGANYPGAAGLFDRVLVDAPCSCEGTSRKEPAVLTRIGRAISLKRSGGQKALLRKAVQLCKPGGRIVYATCTYAPEENEAVVDAIVQEQAGAVRLLPARLDDFNASEGLTEWAGQTFDPSLRRALRVWPHQNDTGGFFIAVLERLAGENRRVDDTPPPTISPDTPPLPIDLLRHLAERFGLTAKRLVPYILVRQSARRIYALAPDHHPPVAPRPDASGLLFMKTRLKYPKLSTAAAQVFGSAASHNYIDTDQAQIEAYVNRQSFPVSARQTQTCTGVGYVLVRHQGFTLGVGLYRPDQAGGGVVESMYPKGWSPTK